MLTVYLFTFFDRGHPVVLIMTILLHKQSSNTTFSIYLIKIDI